jgi:hypothetical protein
VTDPAPAIPTTADDVDHDFDANASPPPPGDPGHLADAEEWAEIVARAKEQQP